MNSEVIMKKDNNIQKHTFKDGSILYYTSLSQYFDLSKLTEKTNCYAVEYFQSKKKQFSSFFSQDQLDYFLKHQTNLLTNIGYIPIKEHSFSLVHKDFVFSVEKFGILNSHIFENTFPNMIHPKNMVSHNLMTDISNPDFTLVDFIESSESIKTFKTLDGELHSEPIFLFSYPKSQLNDEEIDLDAFVEELSKRDDVAFLTYAGRWDYYKGKKSTVLFAPLQGDEENIGGIIHDIEHHLEDGESIPEEKEEIFLIYYPKKDEIEYLSNWSEHIDRNSFDYQKKKIFFLERHIVRNILDGEKFLKHPIPDEPIIVRKFKH